MALPPARTAAHAQPLPRGSSRALTGRLTTPVAIALGALLLRALAGVGFANYDTLYALVWGQQLARGELPEYGVAVAPTPHPLVELLGLVLAPLGARAAQEVTVALGFLALAGCGWVIYRLGAEWFGRAAGALAAVLLLTRVPVLSYGVRAYVDVPYLLLVLGALLVETRRPRAGAPVLALLAVAGLLRPEAWAFSGLYWIYLARPLRSRAPAGGPIARSELPRLALLAAAAPLAWMLSDLLVSGSPLWSLTNTRDTAHTLARPTGIAKAPIYVPRRIGEILRPPVLLGAALGGVLSLLWLPRRARVGAVAGVAAVAVLGLFTAAGLPIDTRYAFPAAGILCVFCGAGVFGWTALTAEDRHRRPWMAGSLVVVAVLLVYAPSQYRTAHRELHNLAVQQQIEGDLVALVEDHSLAPGCGQIGVPNHRPVPLLALRLRTRPSQIVSATEVKPVTRGSYVAPATGQVARDYILDPHDPHPLKASVPAGFTLRHANRSWLVYERCGP